MQLHLGFVNTERMQLHAAGAGHTKPPMVVLQVFV